MKKFAILAGAAAVATAAVALAQPAAGPRADRNADMTRQQVIERVDQRFARLDLDNDGRATAEEARQAAQQRRAQRAERMFDRLDADNDGSISRAEFDQARSQRQAHRAERRGEPGLGRRRGGRHGAAGMRAMRMFGEQGFVTRDQMRERALARFDRLDANSDGTVSAVERRQAREQLRQRIRERRGRSD
jgi:Ca2+-binding EF-hand superfamily protein